MSSHKKRSRPSPPADRPRMGALLRLAWLRVRERIYRGVHNAGYDDLNRAHVSLFRFEGLDGQRPTQLAESMLITKQSVNDLLRHLERRGYLESRADPQDKRARLVWLTGRGRRLDAVVREQARAAEEELAQELGKERFKEFHLMLSSIAEPPGTGTRHQAEPRPAVRRRAWRRGKAGTAAGNL